jgi:hypothetical protein
VTGADGQPIVAAGTGPLWGAIEISSGRGSMSGPLQDSADGTWSGSWDAQLVQDGTPLQVRAWVAARGYLAATIEEMVPGTGETSTPAPEAPAPTAEPVQATRPLVGLHPYPVSPDPPQR